MNAKDHVFKLLFGNLLDLVISSDYQVLFSVVFALESRYGSDLLFDLIKRFDPVDVVLSLASMSTAESKYIVETERLEVLVKRKLHVFYPILTQIAKTHLFLVVFEEVGVGIVQIDNKIVKMSPVYEASSIVVILFPNLDKGVYV